MTTTPNQHKHDTSPTPTSPRRKPAGLNPSRHAFTLIEILVVISIIVVLVALTLVGVSAITANSSRFATDAAFTTLDAAVDEYYDLNNRYPRINNSNNPIYTANGRTTSWAEDFFDELQKYGDIASLLGNLLQNPPDDLGDNDIRSLTPVADGWGIGIVPVIPSAVGSTNPAITSLRPFFYSSGPDTEIQTEIITEMNTGRPSYSRTDEFNEDINPNPDTADDLLSPSAPQ